MTDSRPIPVSPCPHCGEPMLGAWHEGAAADASPEPGDAAVCTECAGLAVFGPDLRLRVPSYAELAGLKVSDDWPEIERHQRAVRLAKQALRRRGVR